MLHSCVWNKHSQSSKYAALERKEVPTVNICVELKIYDN